jgi:hypothetical protein
MFNWINNFYQLLFSSLNVLYNFSNTFRAKAGVHSEGVLISRGYFLGAPFLPNCRAYGTQNGKGPTAGVLNVVYHTVVPLALAINQLQNSSSL